MTNETARLVAVIEEIDDIRHELSQVDEDSDDHKRLLEKLRELERVRQRLMR